jgi:hypothetical protein
MTLLRWLIALFLVGLFYAPIIISAVQIWQLCIQSMPAQPLSPLITEPQVALQLVAARDDVEHDLINDRFSPMMTAMRETSRLPPYTPPTGRPPHLQDQGKRVTVGVVAGRKSTR